jgi:TetR/AcrR family transcriptional regulator, multidrug resistance operon repressor
MRQRDESKELALREKAIEIIINEGFDGLSMQKLAKAANVSPATIYIYFKDRDDLIEQIIHDEAQKMSDATLKDFDPEMGFEEGLRKQWQNRATYFLDNPIRLQFVEQMRNTPIYEKSFKLDPKFSATLRQFAHLAIERKELAKLPLEVYWSIAFAPLYQLVKFHLAKKPVLSMTEKFILTEEKMELALQLVLKALRP